MALATAFLGILAAAVSVTASAAQPARECMMCRAVAHFRTCATPLDGAVLIRGRVVGVEKRRCSQALVVEAEDPATAKTPARFNVDLGGCAFWAGNVGDDIQIALRETPTSTRVDYSLACRLW
jgi:hypothetical protein